MAINNNVNVQCNCGPLPDIILLTRCVTIQRETLLYYEEFSSLQPILFPPKYFDNFPPEGGCSEGLDAFKNFLKTEMFSGR